MVLFDEHVSWLSLIKKSGFQSNHTFDVLRLGFVCMSLRFYKKHLRDIFFQIAFHITGMIFKPFNNILLKYLTNVNHFFKHRFSKIAIFILGFVIF